MRRGVAAITVFSSLLATQVHQPAIAQQPSQAQGRGHSVPARIAKPCIPPDYPIEAVRKNLQGTTRIRFSINQYGEVMKVDLVASSGSEVLDSAAISALSKCNFAPGARDGIPTVSETTVDYVWRIE